MTFTLLLLAAAVCVAPWRGAAVDRLEGPALAAPAGAAAAHHHAATGAASRVSLSTRMRSRRWWPQLRIPVVRTPAPDPDSLAQVADLLRACMTAGLPVSDALGAVADAISTTRPEVAQPLRTAAARVRLGATAEQAWRDVPGVEHLSPLQSVLVRATDGGGSVKAALEHTAVRMRAEADAAATARAERASVLVAGPLGLCFLPAFVCLGVLPVVVGLADDMLPGIGL